jgi:hypothetical protein
MLVLDRLEIVDIITANANSPKFAPEITKKVTC